MNTFENHNLVAFLEKMRLLLMVTAVKPFCRPVIWEFYCNLLFSVGDETSIKFRRVFLRDKLYDFNQSIINIFCHTEDVHESEVNVDINDVTTVLTKGLLTAFPDHPKKLVATNLSSLYSVLQKVAIRNWTTYSNTTVVTQPRPLICMLLVLETSLILENWLSKMCYNLQMEASNSSNCLTHL